MREPHGAIEALFHEDPRRSEPLLDLVALSAMRHRPIAPQDSRDLDGQEIVQLRARRQGPMHIRRLNRPDRNAPIELRQIGRDEAIRLRQRRDPGEAQLFDEAILERLKEPLNAALGLRGVGVQQLAAQGRQAAGKVTLRRLAC